ncbi:MAG: zinc ABC transporter substrate-binding protein [Cyanobacteria bacterium P01_H01_bin.121]
MQRYFTRKHGVVGVALALLVGLASCTTSTPSGSDTTTESDPNAASDTTTESDAATSDATDEAPLDVVASFSVICDLAGQIAADAVELNCLIPPDQDPHTYEATPSDREAVDTADLVFYAGLNFEPAIIEMAEASDSGAPKIALHDGAVQQVIEVEEEGEIEPDPHIWHDVANGLAMVTLIRDNLIEIDPDNADLYTENAEQLTAELQALDTWIPEQIATIPEAQRRLITTHDAMSYYAQAYGLTVEGTLLGVSTEDEPTAATVNDLATSIRDKSIPIIFAELTADDRVLKTVSDEAGVPISEQVLLADGLGAAGTPGESYTGMLVYNTCAIVEGLGGECAPAP